MSRGGGKTSHDLAGRRWWREEEAERKEREKDPLCPINDDNGNKARNRFRPHPPPTP
jgi:hypothetical protein